MASPRCVLVRWEGNQSKRYDNKKEEVQLSSIVAINTTAVIEPTVDQLSVGDYVECEYCYKRGRVQLWRGVVVSTDPDADRRAGVQSSTPSRNTHPIQAGEPADGRVQQQQQQPSTALTNTRPAQTGQSAGCSASVHQPSAISTRPAGEPAGHSVQQDTDKKTTKPKRRSDSAVTGGPQKKRKPNTGMLYYFHFS